MVDSDMPDSQPGCLPLLEYSTIPVHNDLLQISVKSAPQILSIALFSSPNLIKRPAVIELEMGMLPLAPNGLKKTEIPLFISFNVDSNRFVSNCRNYEGA